MGLGFGEPGGALQQEFPGVPPPPGVYFITQTSGELRQPKKTGSYIFKFMIYSHPFILQN